MIFLTKLSLANLRNDIQYPWTHHTKTVVMLDLTSQQPLLHLLCLCSSLWSPGALFGSCLLIFSSSCCYLSCRFILCCTVYVFEFAIFVVVELCMYLLWFFPHKHLIFKFEIFELNRICIWVRGFCFLGYVLALFLCWIQTLKLK